MNRTILIVICDFLLVSLLAFSTVDINKVADEGVERQVRVEISTNAAPDAGKDITSVMRLALDEERKQRDLLLGELERSREAITRQQSTLTERERQIQAAQNQLSSAQTQLREREQQVQNVQQDLRAREQEAARLQQSQAALQQQYVAAQTNISLLNQRLQTANTQISTSRDLVAELQAETRKQAEQAAAMQQQISALGRSNQMVLADKDRLAGQLQVAQVEQRNATQQIGRMQEEIKVQREEKAKLADSFKTLATKSTELAEEIRESRTLTPNTIFNEFVTNRIQVRLTAVRAGMLGGDASKQSETHTVLITDGTNTFAICHSQDTPFAFSTQGTAWEGMSGTFIRGRNTLPVRSLSFGWPDPRAVFLPLATNEVRQLGGKVYRVSTDPYKFQDAILVGAKESYYGECRFQIEVGTTGYVRLDSNFIRSLFGQFNPSRGDLVFSKTGELLGIMANNNYCMMIQKMDASATFKFGQDIRAQKPGDTLSRLYAFVAGLPSKLQ